MTAPRLGSWGTSIRDMKTEVTPLDTRGPKRLWQQGPGFVIRRRGATDEPVALEYMCPVHGRFTARVSKTDTPDEVACPGVDDDTYRVVVEDGQIGFRRVNHCGLTSPWSPSGVSVWKSSGEVSG